MQYMCVCACAHACVCMPVFGVCVCVCACIVCVCVCVLCDYFRKCGRFSVLTVLVINCVVNGRFVVCWSLTICNLAALDWLILVKAG